MNGLVFNFFKFPEDKQYCVRDREFSRFVKKHVQEVSKLLEKNRIGYSFTSYRWKYRIYIREEDAKNMDISILAQIREIKEKCTYGRFVNGC